LIKLRVIALGRWTLLARAHKPPALVFETVWTGNPESYIPDFAMVMPFQWRGIWAGAEGFPGPLPAEGLLGFVREHDWGADHFHSDYTNGATTEIVVRALELDRRLERFIDDTDGLSPLDFAARWDGFLVDAQEGF
jgi:hypothetical protein